MSEAAAPSREAFTEALAAKTSAGGRTLLLAPLGAGKTHALRAVAESLTEAATVPIFLDLFTAASTPSQLLKLLARAVRPHRPAQAAAIENLEREGDSDRRRAPEALLALMELVASTPPAAPVTWIVDEVTEIRSLAYFDGLGRIEEPFGRMIEASGSALAASSYLGLASGLFPRFEAVTLPALSPDDLERWGLALRDRAAADGAIRLTGGSAATLRPLLDDLRASRDLGRSLRRLLAPGAPLETICRRHYDILLVRSRGYAVCKRAAEVVAETPGQRLTDLFPRMGRSAGASRQYLQWLVEVGLLVQVRKRYDFADPLLGLWASLYLGRGAHPGEVDIAKAVEARLSAIGEHAAGASTPTPSAPEELPELTPTPRSPRAPERLEDFD